MCAAVQGTVTRVDGCSGRSTRAPKPYPGSPVGSPGPGFPRVTTRGVATLVRNITGTLVVIQGADILEQGGDDDDGGPAAGPITSALS